MTGADTLIVDDFYAIDHRTADGKSITLPAGAQLIADAPGDGFDILTSGTDSTPALYVGAGSVVDNMTFTASLSPNTGYTGANPQNGTDYHGCRMILASGANVVFRRCKFQGQVNMQIDANNCPNILIEQCEFEGGFYQLRLLGASDNMIYRYNHGHSGVGDCVKTTRTSTAGPRYPYVHDCLFEGMNRDGLDTTGGFKEAVVNDCVFWDLGVAGCDFKAIYEDQTDTDPEITNQNGIRINRCEFYNMDNAMTVTTLDRLDPPLINNSTDAEIYMPNDIVLTDCTVEWTGSGNKRQILLKDGYDIHWVNSIFYGNVLDVNILNDLGVPGWSAHSVTGNVASTGRSAAGSGGE